MYHPGQPDGTSTEHQLLRPSQHGRMPKKSCIPNLLEFLEKITKTMDEGEAEDVVFLDFAKAFDKVPHRRLRAQLRAHGMKGSILR
jgi:hypothetical protein